MLGEKEEIVLAKDMRQNKFYKTANTKYEGYVKCDLCMHDLYGVLICKVESLITQSKINIPQDYKLIEIPEKEAKILAKERKTEMGMIGKTKIIAAKEELDDDKIDSEGVVVPEESAGTRPGRPAEDVNLRGKPTGKRI